MRVEVKQVTDWKRVVDAARFTVRKDELGREPSSKFKHMILRSEHSPIRLLEFDIKVYDVPYWVSVHFVRHHEGLEKFVSTQRDDRTDNETPRGKAPQDAPVNMQFSINAQALINISRVRLCRKASQETRDVWRDILRELQFIAPEVVAACVPNCIYRGFCPEPQSCKLYETQQYLKWRLDYTEDIN